MVDLPQGNVKQNVTLNATQGALLGMLHDGPRTGWELLQEARAGLARFWNVTPSHVYRELAALEQRTLIRPGKLGPRDRRPFSITASGRRAFARWIAEEPGPEQIRFPLLVTLWFGGHLDDATLTSFVDKARAEHEERLAQYRQIDTDDPHVGAVVSFGVHYERAVLRWLDSLDI
jgi:DNA-binding PadR family transcriptional regulator